jgi:hypothetical protein
VPDPEKSARASVMSSADATSSEACPQDRRQSLCAREILHCQLDVEGDKTVKGSPAAVKTKPSFGSAFFRDRVNSILNPPLSLSQFDSGRPVR